MPASRNLHSWLVALIAAAALAAAPAPAHAHIQLETASPGPDETLAARPEQLRLLFSAFIEPRYTAVTLVAPDGSVVETGPVVFIGSSDREFTVALTTLRQAGAYTVRWRTAGADGHVLEGSYTFTLPAEAIPPEPGPPPVAPAIQGPSAMAADAHAHDPAGESASSGPLNVLARLLHFSALLLMIGAVAFRVLLLPRIDGGVAGAELQRRAWRTLVIGAILLAAAMVLRLWLQSVALHGAGRAWSTPLLSIMLNDTTWGRAWLVQALLFAVLGAAIAWARPPQDRPALLIAVPATIGLAAIPGLSGHAAGAANAAWLAVINDTVHVLAVGAWMGTLFLLAAVSFPALLRAGRATDDHPGGEAALRRAAAAVDAFSPIALTAAAVAVATGVINSLFHVQTFGQLLTTPYGRTLLVKVLLVLLVLAAGFVNWRVIRPRLSGLDAVRRLRISASVELALAGLVLIATAILTGLPHP